LNPKYIKWDVPQKRDVIKGKYCAPFDPSKICNSLYRPFFKQYLFFDRYWNNRVYQMPKLFPTADKKIL